MKGHSIKNTEVESNIPSEDTKKITFSNTAFIFDIVFNQMYRDPIGSIVREITSNCFDSHIEAKVEDAVVVEFGEDEGGYFISFKDVGMGISLDRMDKVYKNAGESTKRDSDELIGFWGLGSKSPFSYQDHFFLTTIFDKVEYSYMLYKNDNGEPDIQLLDTQETEDRNGSIVKVYIKTRDDLYLFQEAVDQQLKYFDNVYVKGYKGYNNTYQVFQGKSFKFRTDADLNDTLHLCIGKVTYPISWEKLDRNPIKLPFGLYFDIGELPITPERESVKYVSIEKDGQVSSTILKIKERIAQLTEELQGYADREETEHNNLIDYNIQISKPSYITVAGVDIPFPKILKRKSIVYLPLKALGVDDVLTYPFFHWGVFKVSQGYGMLRDLKYPDQLLISDLSNTFLVRVMKPVNKYKRITIDYIKHLAREENKSIKFIKYKQYWNKNELYAQAKVALDHSYKIKRDLSKDNLLTRWKRYKAIMDTEIVLNSIDYHSIEIPEDWKKNWEATNSAKNTLIAEEGEIIVEDMRAFPVSTQKRTLDLDNLKDYKGFILYGYNSDEDILKSYVDLFSKGKWQSTGHCSIYKIRIKDEKHLIALPNTIYVNSFMSPNPIFKTIATATIVNRSKLWNYNFNLYSAAGRKGPMIRLTDDIIFTPLAKTLTKLSDIAHNTINVNSSETQTKELLESITKIAEDNDWIDSEIKVDIQRVEKYFEGLELINYIVSSEEALPHVVDFFKLSGKKVNAEWYTLEEWQKELIKEIDQKADYINLVLENHSVKGSDYGAVKERNLKIRTTNSLTRYTKLRDSITKSRKELQILIKYHGNKSKARIN